VDESPLSDWQRRVYDYLGDRAIPPRQIPPATFTGQMGGTRCIGFRLYGEIRLCRECKRSRVCTWAIGEDHGKQLWLICSDCLPKWHQRVYGIL
jgi:hypothetical protein